jgi:hypothetical protein
MERKELLLRERIQRLLATYSFEDLLDYNEATEEDILVFLYFEYGFQFPEAEPL